jgi:hypothetical protein
MGMMCDDEDDAFNHIESMNRVKKAFDEEMKMRAIAEQKRHDDMRNEVIEEVAQHFDAMKSGGDTTASFAVYVRAMKT